MNEIITLISKHRQNIFELRNNKEYFVIHLSDFVDFVSNNNQIKPLIKELEKESEKEFEKLIKIEKETFYELKLKFELISSIIKHKKITDEKVIKSLKYTDDFLNGNIRISGVGSENLNFCLNDIYYGLKDINNESIINNYFEEKDGGRIFSKKLEKRRSVEQYFENNRKNKIWGNWDYLKLINKIKEATNNNWANLIFSKDDNIDLDLVGKYVYLLHFKFGRGNNSSDSQLINDYLLYTDRLINYIQSKFCEDNKFVRFLSWFFDMKNPFMYIIVVVVILLLTILIKNNLNIDI